AVQPVEVRDHEPARHRGREEQQLRQVAVPALEHVLLGKGEPRDRERDDQAETVGCEQQAGELSRAARGVRTVVALEDLERPGVDPQRVDGRPPVGDRRIGPANGRAQRSASSRSSAPIRSAAYAPPPSLLPVPMKPRKVAEVGARRRRASASWPLWSRPTSTISVIASTCVLSAAASLPSSSGGASTRTRSASLRSCSKIAPTPRVASTSVGLAGREATGRTRSVPPNSTLSSALLLPPLAGPWTSTGSSAP